MTTFFNNLKCADNANVHAHLDKLQLKHEELIGVGVTISVTDYATESLEHVRQENIDIFILILLPIGY